MNDYRILGGDVRVGWASLPSDVHPTRNEDAFFAMPDRGFYGVFDGMAGHAGADLAARIAADEVQEVLVPLAPDVPLEVVADALRDALLSADSAIHAERVARGAGRGMGTTAAVLVLRPVRAGPPAAPSAQQMRAGAWSALVGWVGDSRVLVLPLVAAARLETLTLDDGIVRIHAATAAQARKAQETLGTVTNTRALTLRERDLFLERNVLLQAVGTSLEHVHVVEEVLGKGDQALLTTDGVHDNLTDREITAVVRRAPSARDAASRLVTAARERSRNADHIRAKPDDMTAIVVRLA